VAFLGVFFAVPLRRTMLAVEKLRFPTGTAAAETITAMFASPGSAMSRARLLLLCGLYAALIALLFSLKPLGLGGYKNLGLDDLGLGALAVFGVPLAKLRIGLSFTPMIWGAGILVGPRVGWTLLGGSLLGWLLLAPAVTVVFTWLLFDIPPWMGVLAVLLSFVICSITIRAVGETDINPSGPMAKITQMLYGFLDPGQVTTNLMAAGITKAGASQAADLMSDLKSGYLLKASIRKQVFAQLIGVLVGVFAVAGVYMALTAAYKIPGKEFTGPAVQAWRAMAKVLSEGFSNLPTGAGWGALVGAVLGIGLTLATRIKKIAAWLPSPVALGIALLIPGYYSAAIWLSALLVWVWKRRRPEQMESYGSSIASGLIAGEAVMTVLVAVLLIAGVSWV
jgi:uncharacterized oligopeptide transporter (OPT) family protein